MMNARKRLKSEILSVANTLKEEQSNYFNHVHYFKSLMQDQKIGLVVLLLPAFIKGWNHAKKGAAGHRFKQLLKLGLLVTRSHIKKTLI